MVEVFAKYYESITLDKSYPGCKRLKHKPFMYWHPGNIKSDLPEGLIRNNAKEDVVNTVWSCLQNVADAYKLTKQYDMKGCCSSTMLHTPEDRMVESGTPSGMNISNFK